MNSSSAEAGLLPGDLRDLERPAQLLDRAPAGDDLPQAVDHPTGRARRCSASPRAPASAAGSCDHLRRRRPARRAGRCGRSGRTRRAAPRRPSVAGSDRRCAVALDLDAHRLVGAKRRRPRADPRSCRSRGRRCATIRSPGAKPGRCGRAARLRPGRRRGGVRGMPYDREEGGEDRRSRAGNWPSARPARSGSAATPAWPGRLRPRSSAAASAIRRRLARRVHVADEPDIAAERQPADLPARAALVGPAGDLAAEADREGLGPDPEPARRRNNGRARG